LNSENVREDKRLPKTPKDSQRLSKRCDASWCVLGVMPELWHCCVYLSLVRIKMRFPDVPNIFNLFSSQIQNFNFIWSVNYFINTLQVTIYVEKKQIILSSDNTYNIIRNNNKRDNKGWQERENGAACGMRAAPVHTVALRRGREDEQEGPNPPSLSPCPSSSLSPRVPPLVIPWYLLLCLLARFSPHLGVCWRCSCVNVAQALICRRCAAVSKVGGIGLVVIGFGVSMGFRTSKAGVLRFLGCQRWLGCQVFITQKNTKTSSTQILKL